MFYGAGSYYTKRKERAEESGPPARSPLADLPRSIHLLISEFGISRVVPRLLILAIVRYISGDLLCSRDQSMHVETATHHSVLLSFLSHPVVAQDF